MTANLRAAMDVWENATGSRVRFVEDKARSPRLIIQKADVCQSGIPGMGSGNTIANLSPGCPLQHELGHVIGLSHEHQRYDRDRYIRLGFDPFSRCDLYHDNGKRCEFASTGSDFGPYRTDSCMHYNSVPPLAFFDKATGAHVPSNDEVTQQDAANARELYAYEYHWSKFFPLSQERVWDEPLDVRINGSVQIIGSPALTSQGGPQVLDMFVRGSDRKIYHRFQTPKGWSGYYDLGGAFDSDPAAASFGTGKLIIAAAKGERVSTLKHRSNSWQSWIDQGRPAGTSICSAPALTTAGSSVYLLARGCDNRVYEKHSDNAGAIWSEWREARSSLPGGVTPVGRPVAVSLDPNFLELFVNTTNGHIWHKRHSPNSSKVWSDLLCCADPSSSPAVTRDKSGRIHVLYRGTDNGLWWHFFDSGKWYGSFALGSLLNSSPAATSGYKGHADVLGILRDGGLWHRWYHCIGDGGGGTLPCDY